jgi:hypothetical protein
MLLRYRVMKKKKRLLGFASAIKKGEECETRTVSVSESKVKANLGCKKAKISLRFRVVLMCF